ncbi:MAG: hypothetical protein HQL32_08880, partial [Planctomycetes bacterium]|nr:hypothetical protein [Planctomycetota bacterium]
MERNSPYNTLIQFLLIISFGVRLFFCTKLNLHNEETYNAILWSHFQSDHSIPFPFFSFLIQPFISPDAAALLRLPSILIFSLSLLLINQLCRQLFKANYGYMALILVHTIPLYLT